MTQGFFQFNNTIINEILNFTTSSSDLFFMSGPKGSSKTEILGKLIPTLEEDNLVFQHFCFDNSVIDDFLLNFYDALRNFSTSQRISLKKVATQNFKEKVTHYFKTLNANCIIIVENFEKVDTNEEIIDFLSHLATYDNVKIIILSRNNESDRFKNKRVVMETLEMGQISKEEFKSKLTALSDFVDDDVKEFFYEAALGLELYLKMGIKYSTLTDIPIKDLLDEFERKEETLKIDFEEFLVSKFVSLTPGTYRNFFKILCSFSHPISTELIEAYNLGNVSYLDYLIKNFLVCNFKKEVYVKDYFREYILNSFSVQEKISHYKRLIAIYENELEKAPKDRLIRLSREAIRKEVDYFNSIIPSINPSRNQNTLAYLGLDRWGLGTTDKPKSALNSKLNKIKEKKKQKLSKEDYMLLASRRGQEAGKKSIIDENKEKNRLNIIRLINSARELADNYKYTEAIDELLKAQTTDYENEFIIEILTLIAQNYEALTEFAIAKKYFDEALEQARKTNDTRVCELCFSIASINKNFYKIDEAKEQFYEIAQNEEFSPNYRAKSYLEAGEIEEANFNSSKAIEDYNSALTLSMGKNRELVSKCYYKLGMLYDEEGDFDNAIKYYLKNYTTTTENAQNIYYSTCLTNLALIYIELSKYDEAADYLKLALEYDSLNEDWENMYFSQKELGKLYSRFDRTIAVGYFKQALMSAENLNDTFKQALIYFEVSELYYDNEDDENALLNLLSAREILGANEDDENIQRIDSRIGDIKMRLDDVSFQLIIEKYEKQRA